MATVISFSLDTRSLSRASRELHRYVADFESRLVRLRQMLADRISEGAMAGFTGASAGDIIGRGIPNDNDVTVTASHDETVSVVIVSGSQAIFIEFGAGVYYNGAAGASPHPWGAYMNYTIGSYGKGKGERQVWGYYYGGVKGKDNLVLTHGTPASMPLYHAIQDAMREFDSMVQEVFG